MLAIGAPGGANNEPDTGHDGGTATRNAPDATTTSANDYKITG